MKNTFENVGIYVGQSSIGMTVPDELRGQVNTTIKINNENQELTGEIVSWGTNNTYPNDFYRKKFLLNGSAVGGVGALKNAQYGSGFQLFKEISEESGLPVKLVPQCLADHPDIQSFFQNSKMNRFWFEIITDQTLFHIGFAHFVVSRDRKKIVSARRQKAAWCRFEKQNEQGIIKNVWINSDWSNENKEYSKAIPYVDPYMSPDDIRKMLEERSSYEFIYASFYPLIDEAYYPNTDWHAVDRNGWIDVANSVPELKKAIFENQMHIKFTIYVSEMYFENFYKDEWETFSADKRKEIRSQTLKAVDDHITGNKSGGRSIISPIFEENGKFVKGIEVIPIDNKLQDGSYLPDASAANSEILFALGVDPCIIGLGIPGGKNLSGSGSDKREAYNILCANLKPRREVTLEVWDLIRNYNQWDPSLVGAFPNMVLTTLDKDKSGQNKIVA